MQLGAHAINKRVVYLHRQGFEPWMTVKSLVLKTSPINHSGTYADGVQSFASALND